MPTASRSVCLFSIVLTACGAGAPPEPDASPLDSAAPHDASRDSAVDAAVGADAAPPPSDAMVADAGPADAADDGGPLDPCGAPGTLVFDDEFSGASGAPPDPTKWHAVTGDWGVDNGELECYTDSLDNAHQDGEGNLLLIARRAPGTACGGRTLGYTSALLDTQHLFAFDHGRAELRARMPTARGMWPAFWALADRPDWQAGGEIDIVEVVGSDPTVAFGTLHGPLAGSSSGWDHGGQHDAHADLAADFHTYGVTWTPGTISFQFDCVTYATVTRESLASGEQWMFEAQPFYLLLNLAVGGSWPGPPDASTTFPQTMTVDYVRVYQ
jgi:beta-glucanase (GH16 family)